MNDLIVKVITKLLFPFILLYGFYVILHGHLSPGGGFSGGAIIGGGFVLFTLSFGLVQAEKMLPHRLLKVVESGGLIWYVLIGLVGVFAGGAFLSNRVAGFPMGETYKLFSSGMILLITFGIGMKVASTMISLFRLIITEEDDHV
jgi:multicomponent Na+:H+ antiporter subunit B